MPQLFIALRSHIINFDNLRNSKVLTLFGYKTWDDKDSPTNIVKNKHRLMQCQLMYYVCG